MGNSISPLQDEEWASIVDSLADEISAGDLPENVVRATELLLSGYPKSKVAKEIGVTTDTIRNWLTKYPTMAVTLAKGRSMLVKWRMNQLEQQFVQAIDASKKILSVDLDGTYLDETGATRLANPKVIPVVAAQARYIIGIFAAQKQDLTVTHELGKTVLMTGTDGLDYIAKKLAEQADKVQEEPIEATFRVIDSAVDNTGPLLKANGEPLFGELGKLDANEEGHLCHICGNRYTALSTHVTNKHSMTAADYEVTYLLPAGTFSKINALAWK